MSNVNPIKQVFSALWTMLEANSDFTSLVKVGNRIKYTGSNIEPDKQQIALADTPEVRVVCTGMKPWIEPDGKREYYASNATFLTVTWAVEVNTGDGGMWPLLNVMFAVFRALRDWRTHMDALTWNEAPFIHRCVPGEAKVNRTDPQLNRGIRGWVTVWTGETNMQFQSSALIA